MQPPADDRLALFRSEWPRHISWAEVRAEDPEAFRMAARGGWVLLAAVLTTLLWWFLGSEHVDSLPAWISWISPLLYVASLWGGIMFWLGGLIRLTMPSDAKRAIAIRRFGEARGLRYMRFGFAPPRVGIMFAEGSAVPLPRRLRGRLGDPRRSSANNAADGSPVTLFRAEHALWAGNLAYEPTMQIGVASYSGSKSDPKGPRHGFRYLTMGLSRDLPHLMIDSLRNGSLRSLLPGTERMSLEGDFDRYFAVYAPKGYERDALEILTPDVMACLIDYGRNWDIEVVEDRLIVASSKVRGWNDCDEVTALLRFSEIFGDELGHQAATYSDPRAAHPRYQVAVAGRRLTRRSAAWTTAIFIVVVGAMLAFPHVLGWLLDR